MHCRASAAVAWLCVLLVSAFIAGSQAHTVEGGAIHARCSSMFIDIFDQKRCTMGQ